MPQNWANGLCAPAATPAHYADGATPGGHIAPPVESTATPGLEGPKTTTPDRVYGGQYQRIYDMCAGFCFLHFRNLKAPTHRSLAVPVNLRLIFS